jgi:membrane protein
MTLPAPVGFGKRLLQQVLDDDVPDLAAGLAYRFLFAIFPFLIFLAALAAFVAQAIGVGDPTGQIMGAIGDNLPPDVSAQITPQVEQVLGQTRPALLSIGAVLALWAATGAIGGLQKAMNSAYDVPESRNLVVKTGGAVLLTLIGSAGILVAFVTIVGGSLLTQEVVKALGVPPSTWDVVSLARWPLVLVLVAIAVSVLLKFAPNVSVSFRWTLVGGVAFAVTWLIATAVFGFYVANFGNYSNTYGALGGVIVMLLWFYITAILLLVSAELTSMLVKTHEPHKVRARKQELADVAEGTADAEHKVDEAADAAGHVIDGVTPHAAPGAPWSPPPSARGRAPIGPVARTVGPRDESGSGLFAATIVACGLITGASVGLLARAWSKGSGAVRSR